MKLKEAKISILIGRDGTTIELIDSLANITFAIVTLTPEQLSSALSRLAYTPCEIEVAGLTNVGKRREHETHEFEIPNKLNRVGSQEDRWDALHQIALATCPEGWMPSKYYGSQSSFFSKGDKAYARTSIVRWVELNDQES